MRYLSTFSGIEAASVAWGPLGFVPVAFAEVDPFCNTVLSHHYPDVPNLGDVTTFSHWPDANLDVLAGGSPCQSFSLAGLRKGMDDPRGNLLLSYLGIADRFRPRWVVWENVPGVLSSNGGRAFGTFLGALEELGYGWAYRVLDAQYFGVAQVRRRVFVVGCLDGWQRSGAVLFERESLLGVSAPIGAEDEPDADVGDEVRCLGCGILWTPDGGLECCPICGSEQSWAAPLCGTLSDGAHMGGGLNGQDATSGRLLVHAGLPRRLTPTECERLQGFPDGWTDVPYKGRSSAPDGPRFRAIANSIAVPVLRYLGRRLQFVDSLPK
jgi:DNA (cytosine-5)-methyltransferase 1